MKGCLKSESNNLDMIEHAYILELEQKRRGDIYEPELKIMSPRIARVTQ